MDTKNLLNNGKKWMGENCPSNWDSDSYILKWAGICCNEKSNKYIFAALIEEDIGYSVTSFYGRIGNFPQVSKKEYNSFAEAENEFEKYIRQKKRQYETVEFDKEIKEVPEKDEDTDNIQEYKPENKWDYKDLIEKEQKEEAPKTWSELSNKYAPFVGKADTIIGEICRALNFAEYRARSQNDWLNFGMTTEEADESLCVEPLGYFLNVFSNSEEDLKDLLNSKTKEEWMIKLNSIKNQILNSNVDELASEKNEDDMSNGTFHQIFMNFWNKNKN